MGTKYPFWTLGLKTKGGDIDVSLYTCIDGVYILSQMIIPLWEVIATL